MSWDLVSSSSPNLHKHSFVCTSWPAKKAMSPKGIIAGCLNFLGNICSSRAVLQRSISGGLAKLLVLTVPWRHIISHLAYSSACMPSSCIIAASIYFRAGQVCARCERSCTAATRRPLWFLLTRIESMVNTENCVVGRISKALLLV